jgi:DNA-binding SARP family transcriptional activator
MNRLKIFMLGQSQITWDDKPVMISRRATRTLLFYLASQRKPIGRSMLCDLFWPENSESNARNRLRGLIAKLKHSLPDPDLLVTHNDQVSLDHSKIYVDQHDFTDQYAALRDVPWHYAEITPLPKPIAMSLVQACSLWKGARFLGDTRLVSTINLDNWLIYTEESLTSLRLLCLDRLASHYVKIGETEAAVECLVTLKRYDEGNPNLHHRLISALMRGGFLMEAKKSLDGSISYFEKQLGVPLPGQIVQDREHLQKLLNQVHTALSPHWPKPLPLHLNLVGRQEEVATLQRAYHEGGTLILTGEAGSGKTRLIQELYERSWPNMRLLLANCTESGKTQPLQTVVDALRSGIEPGEWLDLPNLWANFLSLLIPDLTLIKPNLVIPDRLTHNKGEGLIFEAIMNLLKLAAIKQRILFVLDDAQWVDVTTLGLVQHLVNHDFFKLNGLLLICYRSEENNPELQRLLKSLTRQETLLQVELHGLSDEEVDSLVQQVVMSELNPTLVTEIAHQTGGNPYLVLETIRAIRSSTPTGEIITTLGPLPIARNVQVLIEQKMARLDTQSLDCLQAAATLGTEFSLNTLKQMVDLPTRDLENPMRQLTQVAFLSPIDTPPGSSPQYQFNHMIEQSAILAIIHPAKVQELHARAAKALEQTLLGQADQQASRIAHHYQRAGATHDAIKWWLRAAKHAWDLFSKEATSQAYREIEDILIQNQALISDEDVFAFFSQFTLYAYEVTDFETLERICHMCLEWGQNRQSPLLIGTAFHGMSYLALPKSRYHEGLRYLDKAVTYISLTDQPYFLANVYMRRGFFLTMLNRHREALQSFNSGLLANETVSGPEALELNFQGHYHKSNMLYTLGQHKEGLQEIETAVDQFEHILRPFSLARAHLSYCYNLVKLGRYEEARAHAEDGLRLGQTLGNITFELYFKLILAQYEIRKGELDKGFFLVMQVVRDAEQTQQEELLMRAYGVLGELFLLLNDYESAESSFRKGTHKALNSHAYYEYRTKLALCLAVQGKIEESEELLRIILDHSLQTDMKSIYSEAMVVQAYINLTRGELDTISFTLEDLIKDAEHYGIVEVQNFAKLLQLVLYGVLKIDRFENVKQDLYDWSERTGSPWAYLIMLPHWLMYTQCSAAEKEKHKNSARKIIDTIDLNSQAEELKESLAVAKERWQKDFE